MGGAAPVTPTPPPAAKTERYNVEYRDCVAGDTWETLGKMYYGAESAASALREYNRTHPRASDGIHRKGTISQGDRVYIPPVDVLERRGFILTTPAAPAAGGNPAAAPAKAP